MSLDVESSCRLIFGWAKEHRKSTRMSRWRQRNVLQRSKIPTRGIDQEVEPRLADKNSEALLSLDGSLQAGGGETRSTAAQRARAQEEERTQRSWLTKEERRRAHQAEPFKLYRRRLGSEIEGKRRDQWTIRRRMKIRMMTGRRRWKQSIERKRLLKRSSNQGMMWRRL